MSNSPFNKLFLEIDGIRQQLCEVRDAFLTVKHGEGRFMDLEDAYANLNNIEQGLFQFEESKKPLFGSKRQEDMLLVARSAINNSKLVGKIANEELKLVRFRQEQQDRQVSALKVAVDDERLSSETRAKAERALSNFEARERSKRDRRFQG